MTDQCTHESAAGVVDLSAAEALLELPIPIPVYSTRGLNTPDVPEDFVALACFNPPGPGLPFGIYYDPEAITVYEADPNESLLHELVHAWQWFLVCTAGDSFDPERWPALVKHHVAEHGYHDAPHEVEARMLARELHDIGIRVYFPTD